MAAHDLRIPPWLNSFVTSKFFTPGKCECGRSKPCRKYFCIQCGVGNLCSMFFEVATRNLNLGVILHCGHSQRLQVRLTSHRNSIRVKDIEKHVAVVGVQNYTINYSEVYFLRSRARERCANSEKGVAKKKARVLGSCAICKKVTETQELLCSFECMLEAKCKNWCATCGEVFNKGNKASPTPPQISFCSLECMVQAADKGRLEEIVAHQPPRLQKLLLPSTLVENTGKEDKHSNELRNCTRPAIMVPPIINGVKREEEFIERITKSRSPRQLVCMISFEAPPSPQTTTTELPVANANGASTSQEGPSAFRSKTHQEAERGRLALGSQLWTHSSETLQHGEKRSGLMTRSPLGEEKKYKCPKRSQQESPGNVMMARLAGKAKKKYRPQSVNTSPDEWNGDTTAERVGGVWAQIVTRHCNVQSSLTPDEATSPRYGLHLLALVAEQISSM